MPVTCKESLMQKTMPLSQGEEKASLGTESTSLESLGAKTTHIGMQKAKVRLGFSKCLLCSEAPKALANRPIGS